MMRKDRDRVRDHHRALVLVQRPSSVDEAPLFRGQARSAWASGQAAQVATPLGQVGEAQQPVSSAALQMGFKSGLVEAVVRVRQAAAEPASSQAKGEAVVAAWAVVQALLVI